MSDSLTLQSDAELLKRFAKTRCELVFAELMERYGRLVMTIGLRALRNQHDAEDVFQATFLVLAEKAAKIRKRESLPSWLSGVAHRLSMNLARKRHRKDLSLKAEPEAARDHFADLEQRFDEQAMDEELQSLPSKYRDVLLRFYFLGQTSRQIAESLGITQGAADGRIKRGRQELRVRLAKRGVALGAFTVMALSAQTASAAVAPTLLQSTVAAAAAKGSVGLVSSSVVKLAGTELMKTSSMISSVAAASAVLVFLALGTFGLNAAFARAAVPGEFPINTRVGTNEPGVAASVVALTQEGNAAKAVDTEPQKSDAPRDEKAAVDPRPGSDVYQFKADTIDEQIEAAKEVAPNAHYRKRSDRIIVDGSGPELSKVQELFAKSDIAPVSQMRMDPAPSLLGRLKAVLDAGQKSTAKTYQIRLPLKARDIAALLKRFETGESIKTDVEENSVTVTANQQEHEAIDGLVEKMAEKAGTPGFHEAMENTLRAPPLVQGDQAPPRTSRVADLYEFKSEAPAKVRVEVLKEFPEIQTKVQEQYLVVFGSKEHRKQVAKIIDKVAPKAKHSEIPAAGSPPEKSEAGANTLYPMWKEPGPGFVKARLSQDGQSIAIDAPVNVAETYTVEVPVDAMRQDKDGNDVKVTVMRPETRTRFVERTGVPQGATKKVYKISELQIGRISGTQEIPEDDLRAELNGQTPVIVLAHEEALSALYQTVLKPSVIVIRLPKTGDVPAPTPAGSVK